MTTRQMISFLFSYKIILYQLRLSQYINQSTCKSRVSLHSLLMQEEKPSPFILECFIRLHVLLRGEKTVEMCDKLR